MLRYCPHRFLRARRLWPHARGAQTSPIPAADYKVARIWRMGGSDGWDTLALEASGARLFVTRDDQVDVIETVSGKLVGNIPRTVGRSRHRIRARAEARLYQQWPLRFRLGIRTRYAAGASEVPVSGTSPDAILYEPQQNHIFTANGESANLRCSTPGHTAGRGHRAAARPAGIHGTADSAGTCTSISTRRRASWWWSMPSRLTVKAKWLLKECAGPTGLAIDAAESSIVLGMRKPSHGGNGLGIGQASSPKS